MDGNHAETVRGLRSVGATVRSLAAVGDGCPDLLVGFRGVNTLLEMKDGLLVPSHRVLTVAEQEFFDTWAGTAYVATSVEEAVLLVVEASRK